MDFSDFLERVQRVKSFSGMRPGDLKVRIVVCSPGGLGAMPTVEVKSVHRGIDWDSGSFLITPEKPLTVLTEEQLEAVKKAARDAQSFEAYDYNKKLKAENKSLSEEVARLKSELSIYGVQQSQPKEPLPVINVDIPIGTNCEPVSQTVKDKPKSPYTTTVSLFATKNGKPVS